VRIGIDLGGTKIEGVLLAADGRELARDRAPTPRDDYEAVLDAIARLVARLERQGGDASASGAHVGVGTPGFLAPHDGLLRNSNLLTLNGKAMDRDLSARLGRPVRVANDANCFVLSETVDGAATPAAGAKLPKPDVVFGATLGTGVGGGFVIDGVVQSGANGSAGQWSHTTLPFRRDEDGDGDPCPCGHPGCIESYLAGRGLAWDYRRENDEAVSPEEIGRREQAGDPKARATFARYEDRLARALAAIINFVDPRVIVLGGGVSNNTRLFDNVPALLGHYTVAASPITRIVRARHGDASGVRGAAWLWPDDAGP
jgi:fructokinase